MRSVKMYHLPEHCELSPVCEEVKKLHNNYVASGGTTTTAARRADMCVFVVRVRWFRDVCVCARTLNIDAVIKHKGTHAHRATTA